MPACAVFNCKKKSKTSSLQKDGVTFHFFPKDHSQRKKWVDACNRHVTWTSTRTSTICSLHFESSQFQKLSSNRRRLVAHAVPTLFLTDLDSDVTKENVAAYTQSSQSITYQKASTVQNASATVSSNVALPEPSNLPNQAAPSMEIAPADPQVLSPRKKKLIKCISEKTKKIRKLQSTIRSLKKKVATLEDILND